MAGDVVATSRADWEAYFASVPAFTCSDPYLETAYWYRWYGLRLLTVDVRAGQLPYPCVFEGIGAFRSHITYSAQCHLRETLLDARSHRRQGLAPQLSGRTRRARDGGARATTAFCPAISISGGATGASIMPTGARRRCNSTI